MKQLAVNAFTVVDQWGNDCGVAIYELAARINHSCDPNCDAFEEKGRMYIDAIKNIKAGEELTYDYNLIVEERYTPALKRMYACACGSRKCRGHILGSKR